MAFSSGTFTLVSGNPVTTNTTISSTWANNTLSDIATGLTTCVLKDGTQTMTAALPMSNFRITGLGSATARTDAITAAQVQDSTTLFAAGAAGTNTVTVSCTPAVTAYATGQRFVFRPANTNTGATTININSVGATSVFWNGAACVGSELRQNIPAAVWYDGTQFHIVGNGFNAPFLDTHEIVEGSADSTKKIRFEVDGLTTATTRVITAPDSNTTLPIASQIMTFSGPTAARTYTFPDASATIFTTAGGTLVGNLLFTDATYDIGASGATRPRDLFLSRNFTAGGNIQGAGSLIGGGVISVSLDADTNDWAPTGLSGASAITLSGATATRAITGLTGGAEGRILQINNRSANSYTFPSESASSAAANRFRCAAATTITLRSDGSITMVYQGSRWCIVGA